MERKVELKRNVRRVRLSLRYKLLMILTLIPMATLALYLQLAINEFENDKIAYVNDSGVAVAKSLAMQIRVEVESYLGSVKPIIEGYDATVQGLSAQAQDLFARYPRLIGLVLYQGDAAGNYQKLAEVSNKSSGEVRTIADLAAMESFRTRAANHGLVVTPDPYSEASVVIASRLGRVTDASHLVFVGLYRAETLIGAFTKAQLYRNFLIDDRGQVALGPKQLQGSPLDGEDLKRFFAPVLAGTLPESSLEIKNSMGRRALVSYSQVGVGTLKVASVVDRKEALKGVDLLIAKSLLFFVALAAATILISVFASFQLTSTLRDLYEATRKIASGKFDVRIKSMATDEIGGLADGFNVMASEVSRLMSETAQKARMENELATVKTVQETLFPPTENKFGRIHISGHFEPASECGGDWWNYSKIGDKIYLWIGDATGHGAPAALITSAARSAAAVIESLGNIGPGKALEIMNHAIHETSKGKINMTFFLAMVDENSGKLIYANASHDPPYLVRKPKDRPLSKRDLIPLMDVNGLRLGEKIGSVYEECALDLEPGDTIIFYTDGIIDLQNMKGARWGERTFLKTVVEANGGGQDLSQKMSFIRRSISQYRGDADLLDDITLFMAEFKEAA
jgi:sigma-B regulation protein RsbU (phosphoserine phosphatase)